MAVLLPPLDVSPELTPLEHAFGMTLGAVSREPLIVGDDEPSPRQAMETVLLEALQRPPCLLSFSGGRDSSALLALAVHVARREGLPLPVPATNRFRQAESTDEDEWQSFVLDATGLCDRIVLDFTDELELIGPYARPFLLRHGARWPMNTHMHAAIVEAAAGGTVVTGFGGDEIGRSSQLAFLGQLRAGSRRPRPGDLPQLGLAASPRWVRKWVARRRLSRVVAALSWLTPAARELIIELAAAEELAQSSSWNRLLTHYFWTSRYLQLCVRSFDRLGSDHDVRMVHPFVNPSVLRSFARHGGPGGLGSRGRILKALTGELLPDDILTRRSKAYFDNALWAGACTDFALSWSGQGFDPDLIDAEKLRADWADPRGSVRAFGMLQAAWVHDHRTTP